MRALVTGGGQGIGAAIATALAREGAMVAVNDLPAVVESSGGREGEFLWIAGDLTEVEECRRVVTAAAAGLGGLDVLVNNVGGPFEHVPFEETTEEHFDHLIDVNLKSAFFVAQAAAPQLRGSGRGRIVNLASELFFLGHPELAPYVSAKGGVVGLTRSLALALAPSVTVNAVAPGPTLTERLKAERWFQEDGDHQVANVPLQRWGAPEDVARAVCFLAGPDAGWITGEVLNVNGGIVMP